MTTFARRVVEELHAFADIPVTHQDVDRAWEEFHAPAGEAVRAPQSLQVGSRVRCGVVAVAVGVGW